MDDEWKERRRGPSTHELEIRLSLLEQNLMNLQKTVEEGNKNLTWLVRIVLAAVVGGMMTLLLKGVGPGIP